MPGMDMVVGFSPQFSFAGKASHKFRWDSSRDRILRAVREEIAHVSILFVDLFGLACVFIDPL